MGMDGAVRLDGLKEAAATVDAAALEEARFGFARAHPQRSARRVLFYTQALAFAALITAFVFAARSAPTLGQGRFGLRSARVVKPVQQCYRNGSRYSSRARIGGVNVLGHAREGMHAPIRAAHRHHITSLDTERPRLAKHLTHHSA